MQFCVVVMFCAYVLLSYVLCVRLTCFSIKGHLLPYLLILFQLRLFNSQLLGVFGLAAWRNGSVVGLDQRG